MKDYANELAERWARDAGVSWATEAIEGAIREALAKAADDVQASADQHRVDNWILIADELQRRADAIRALGAKP